jgi:hypothetical protein
VHRWRAFTAISAPQHQPAKAIHLHRAITHRRLEQRLGIRSVGRHKHIVRRALPDLCEQLARSAIHHRGLLIRVARRKCSNQLIQRRARAGGCRNADLCCSHRRCQNNPEHDQREGRQSGNQNWPRHSAREPLTKHFFVIPAKAGIQCRQHHVPQLSLR